jgi:hypothetical protein
LVPENFSKFSTPRSRREERRRLWLQDGRGLWLAVGSGSRLAGLYELPTLPAGTGAGPVLRTIRRRISSTDYVEPVHGADGRLEELLVALRSDGQEVQLFSLDELERLPISGPHGRCIADILANG